MPFAIIDPRGFAAIKGAALDATAPVSAGGRTVAGFFAGIGDAIGRFVDAWNAIGSLTNNPISRFLSSIVAMIDPLNNVTGLIGNIADVLDDVSKGVEKFWDAWTGGGDQDSEVSSNIKVSESEPSYAVLMHSFAMMTEGSDIEAMMVAASRASSMSRSSGTTRCRPTGPSSSC